MKSTKPHPERPPRMSGDSAEMKLAGFKGTGTVTRHEGENFIIVARDETALALFWKRWAPGMTPDVTEYKRTLVVSADVLEPTI